MTDKPLSMKSLKEDSDKQAENVEERFAAIDLSVAALTENVSELSESVNTKFDNLLKAINNPVTTTKGVDSRDVYEHQDEHGIVFAQGRPEDDVKVIEHSRVATHTAEFEEKADQTKFDQEMVEVYVMPSQAAYPDNYFTIGVNGRSILLVRGTKQWIPRNYVEVLARAKTSSYGNVERVNAATGEREVENPETKAQRYPFQLLQDRNPKGKPWFERIMNEATM